MISCYHCGESLPLGEPRFVRIDGVDRPVCCAGCEAVAGLIAGAGLTDFYRYRDGPAPTPAAPDEWDAFDRDAVQQSFVQVRADGLCEATLAVDHLYCAACAWLIERMLGRIDGVATIEVNPASGRALLRWDPERVALSRLLRRIDELGYRPHPLGAGAREPAARREQRAALQRLAVGGFGMMQVMMYAVALYAGAIHAGMDADIAALLRGVSLLVATPVVFYAGAPFFRGAWRDLRMKRPGMDVPVALAVGGAYSASVWNTLIGSGEVYFDSVTMFVFFLSVARFFEMRARHRATDAGDALARTLPATAQRLDADGHAQRVARVELAVGDRLRVAAGEPVAADGRVVAGTGRLDESLLTGEFRPLQRGPGEAVLGGSVNTGGPFDMEVTRTGGDTLVAGIARLLERAQSQRPRLARSADAVARWFVAAVLVLAAGTALAWWHIAPAEAFAVTLAVLVVTCPCALSLATPTALVAATSRLVRDGVLVVRSGALETLARADRVVFDKTGTLTTGELTLQRTEVHSELDAGEARALAAALEAHSEHPLARAFVGAEAGIGVALRRDANTGLRADDPERHEDDRRPAFAPANAGTSPPGDYGISTTATDIRINPGHGIEGTVNGRRLRIGRADWVASAGIGPAPGRDANTGLRIHDQAPLDDDRRPVFAQRMPAHSNERSAHDCESPDETLIALGEGERLLATFHLADTPRPGAAEAVADLRALGIAVEIASGDAEIPVAALARGLGIDDWHARQAPDDKLARLRALQAGGERVIMVGDGINDAPVLGGADASVAMGGGSALAQSSADLVLTGSRLAAIAHGVRSARRTLAVVRQNMAWAIGYNTIALPLAMSGQLAPWMAALGMSGSSLIVVANAMRLGRGGRRIADQAGQSPGGDMPACADAQAGLRREQTGQRTCRSACATAHAGISNTGTPES